MIVVRKNQLKHYGVLGMRWGHRKTPEKSVGIRRKKSQKEDSSDKRKKYLKMGVAAVATGLAVYGGYKLYKSGNFDKIISKGTSVLKTEGIDSPLNSKKSISKVIKDINPSKSRTNCRACAMASVFRLRGFNVDAMDVSGGKFSDAIESCFKGAKVSEMYNPSKEKVISYMSKKYKEGDYGAIAGTFKTVSGPMSHAFNWIVKDGSVKFFDGQQSSNDCARYIDLLISNKSVEIAKLNDAEINIKNMYKFVKKRK